MQYNDIQHTKITNIRNRHNTLNNNPAHDNQQRTDEENKNK